MDFLTWDERLAEQAELRLAAFERAKEHMRKTFMATYGPPALNISPDGNYTLLNTWAAIEQSLDDYTHYDRCVAEKTIEDYESKSKRSHQRQESTYTGARA